MKVALICCTVALFAASASAQWGLLPAPSMSNFQTLYKTVTTVHSVLAKSPIAPFLPSPYTMAMDAWKVYSAASDMQTAMQKASDSVMNTIKTAGEKAKLPTGSMDKITSQIGQMFQSASSQVQEAGSAVNNMIKSEAPTY